MHQLLLICLALGSLGHLDFLDAALPLVDGWLAEVFLVIPLREAPLNGAGLLCAESLFWWGVVLLGLPPPLAGVDERHMFSVPGSRCCKRRRKLLTNAKHCLNLKPRVLAAQPRLRR